MGSWTPQDWLLFFSGLGAFLTAAATPSIINIILTVRGNAKIEAARAISADTNQKTNAIVRQTNELAKADPVASSAPTDALIQRGDVPRPPQRASDPI